MDISVSMLAGSVSPNASVHKGPQVVTNLKPGVSYLRKPDEAPSTHVRKPKFSLL